MPTIAALFGELITTTKLDSCLVCSLECPLRSVRFIRNLYHLDRLPLVANSSIPYDIQRRSQPGATAYLAAYVVRWVKGNGQDEPWAPMSMSECLRLDRDASHHGDNREDGCDAQISFFEHDRG